MIPETEANKSIELYKCTDFPMKWEYYGKIMDDIREKLADKLSELTAFGLIKRVV